MSAASVGAAIAIKDLAKTYVTPWTRRRVHAVRGLSLEVARGELFGFLGPNGAGKTTTIRMLMALIRPTSGAATLMGEPIGSRQARAKVGFLPETPYFYDYLTVGELCDLAGRLHGLGRADRKRRSAELVALVGLGHAGKRPLKSFSKGMLQRAGIAQALMGDPELVVFDEPMSGLDPIGRKEVRDIMLGLRERGKTVFFSTHILADVETMADRIAIIVDGAITDVGGLAEVVGREVRAIDLTLGLPAAAEPVVAALSARATATERTGDELRLTLAGDADVDAIVAEARGLGARLVELSARRASLEDLFIRRARREERAP